MTADQAVEPAPQPLLTETVLRPDLAGVSVMPTLALAVMSA